MFDLLTDKLTAVFERLGNRGRLTERDVDEALREVRLALLEADVNFRVVRDLVNQVRVRAVGQDVLRSLTPGQQVVKIVHEELTSILTAGSHRLMSAPQRPTVGLLVGLQGSGKTTTIVKLATHLRQDGHQVLLIAADLRRPAAIEQLVTLGKQANILVYEEGTTSTMLQVACNGVEKAKTLGVSWVLIDTGGRLHIDDELMEELQELRHAVNPTEVLLVADAMTGQDAVNAASEFHSRLQLTGLILTKLDGDARGGAALSMPSVTGVPIKFVGTGERTDALEGFYPERLASRILGMGDIVSLVEKAQRTLGSEDTKALEKKIRAASFDLDDFLKQLQQVKGMGPLSQLLDMVPGFSQMKRKMSVGEFDENRLKRVEALIYSMTLEERRTPDIINGSRKRRIAKGSGTTPQDVNQLLNQFRQMQKLMRQFSSGRGRRHMMQMFQ